MSYQSTRLSFTPALYWPLDMVGTVADGDVVPDISGNGLDGEVNLLAGTAGGPGVSSGDGVVPFIYPYGNPSPIENDSSSRAFAGHNWNVGADTEQSRIFVASDPLIEPVNDFTLDGWLWIPRADMGNDPSDGTTKQHLFGKFNVAEIYIDTFNKIAGAIKDSAGNFYRVVAAQPFVIERWYYVALVRLGNALTLYIDAQLQGVTTITSGLGSSTATPDFMVHNTQIAPADCLYAQVAFQLNALTQGNITTIHESAFNVLTMRGECNITTSAVLRGDDDPDPAEYSFRHNWTEPVIERFRWRTGVFKPVDGPVGLARQRSAWRRQVEYQHLLYNEKLRRQFEARAFGGRTTVVQFEPDKVQVGTLLAGATMATFDTRLRDFEVDHRVLIYQDDENYEFHTLIDVTDDGIEWDEGLSQNYLYAWVKPARVARLPTTQEVELHNDIVGESSNIYEYLPEDEPLNPRRIVPFTPTLNYQGREVFDLAEWQGHDYSELPTIEYVADRFLLDEGTGAVSDKQYRWGADVARVYNMNLEGRELIAKYLGWLHHRAGQYQPFWMPTFVQNLKPLSRTGNDLTVEGHEYSNYYANADNRLDLVFVYFDNTVVLRRILSSTVDGVNDLLSLDAAVPSLTGLRWLSFLRRVVLSSDDVEIAWQTDNVVRVAFAVVDAPIDTTLGSPSASPTPSSSLSGSQSPSASLSPSHSASPSV